jgi:hypothetical protein
MKEMGVDGFGHIFLTKVRVFYNLWQPFSPIIPTGFGKMKTQFTIGDDYSASWLVDSLITTKTCPLSPTKKWLAYPE